MTVIRIDQPAFALFNGKLGGVKFNNGVSERALTPKELRRVGINVRIVDAETGDHVIIHKSVGSVEARHLVDVPTAVEETKTVVEFVAPNEPIGPNPFIDSEEFNVGETTKVVYTKEELEAVADKTGIKGIREIATTFDVKGVQIAQLIDGILTAQG